MQCTGRGDGCILTPIVICLSAILATCVRVVISLLAKDIIVNFPTFKVLQNSKDKFLEFFSKLTQAQGMISRLANVSSGCNSSTIII
jgi:hypothetical protein